MKKIMSFLGIAALALTLAACKPAAQKQEEATESGAQAPVVEPAQPTAEATTPTEVVPAAVAPVTEAATPAPGTEANAAAPVQDTEKSGQ